MKGGGDLSNAHTMSNHSVQLVDCCHKAARARAASASSTPSAQRCNSEANRQKKTNQPKVRVGKRFRIFLSIQIAREAEARRLIHLKGSKTDIEQIDPFEHDVFNLEAFDRSGRTFADVHGGLCRVCGGVANLHNQTAEPQMWRYYLYKNYMGNPTRETETEKVSAFEPDEEPF